MDPVVHFQIPADDKKKMSKFYNQAFGWEAKQMGEEVGDYMVITTSETDEKGMIKRSGAINGGFFTKGQDEAAQRINIVIAVKDINESMKKVEKAGGKVNSQPDNIPNVGLFATFVDPEGNHMVMLQPKGM